MKNERGGEILAGMGLQGGDRKSKSHDATLKLTDIGINKSQSSRWILGTIVSKAEKNEAHPIGLDR